MASMCKVSILRDLDENRRLFVSIPKIFDFDGFMKKIFERFPDIETQQFYMFYRDAANDKIMIGTASDYRQFWEQELNKIFIVMGSLETPSFETQSPHSGIPSTIDKLMEHLTKENEKFKSNLLEEIKKMIDTNQETGNEIIQKRHQAPESVEEASANAVQSDERVNKNSDCINNDVQSPCQMSVPNSTEKEFTNQDRKSPGIEEADEDIGSVASAAGCLDNSLVLEDPVESNKTHQTSTENATNPNSGGELKNHESAGFTDFRVNENFTTLNATETKNENESSDPTSDDTKVESAAEKGALGDATIENMPSQQHPTSKLESLPQTNTVLNSEEDPSLIDHQCSLQNASGKRCYTRDQIMQFRLTDASQALPQFEDHFSLIRKNSQPNKNGKETTKKDKKGRSARKGIIHVSLSLIKDDADPCEVTTSEPVALTDTTDPNNIGMMCTRVRRILDQLSSERLESVLQQLQEINIDSKEKISAVTSLMFEMAIDKPQFSQAYAQLCQKLSKPMKEEEEENEVRSSDRKKKTALFKKELLNRCQTEFNTHVANENAIREKLKPMQTEFDETNDPHRKIELTAQMHEEEHKLRRRSVGTVRFIGELYRKNMILTSILEWCVIVLLNIRTDEKLECLCELLTIAGQKMEHKTQDKEYDKKYYRDLTPHFQSIHQIIELDQKQSIISDRVRLMLMDVIELRKNNWMALRSDSNPKICQTQQDKMEFVPNNRSMLGSGLNKNNKLGLGDNYQDNDGWIQASNGNSSNSSQQFDASKFRTSAKIEDIKNTTLGTPNQFQWKFNTQPQATTSANPPKEPYHS